LNPRSLWSEFRYSCHWKCCWLS